MDYIFHILIMILLYIMLSQSLVIIVGYSGMISLAHAGFYGIGAYISALLFKHLGLSFLMNLSIAVIICAIIALICAKIAIRTVDDYFIIITLGIQVIIFSLMNNLDKITNGSIGISGIKYLSLFSFVFNSKISFLLLSLVITVLIYLILRYITRSPFGLVLSGLSEDEIFTASLGKNVNSAKTISFTIGAMLAAIPGVIFAHYVEHIDPTCFKINESILILAIVIIGGKRRLWGAAIAGACLIILPEILKIPRIPNNIAANLREIIYGSFLVLIMFRYTKGFIIKVI